MSIQISEPLQGDRKHFLVEILLIKESFFSCRTLQVIANKKMKKTYYWKFTSRLTLTLKDLENLFPWLISDKYFKSIL